MAQAGHRVTLLGRPAHMDAIRTRGVRIEGIWGEHAVTNLTPLTSLDTCSRGDFDLILITVKTYDTVSAVDTVKHLVDEQTLVCSYQNGLGNAEAIAERVGWERTISARPIYGVRVLEPGRVVVTVIASPTAVGAYDAHTDRERVRAIAESMNAAGLPTVFTDEITTVLWAKVAYNCALNPMSALLDVTYGGLLDTEHTRSMMREIVHELYAVAEAMKIDLKPPDPKAYVEYLFNELIPPTAAHFASMHEDFEKRRRTEIDALNGAIVRFGEQHGIPCPTNAALTRLVHAREHALGIAN